MRRRVLIGLVFIAALTLPAQAQAVPCYGAPADYRAAFNTDYPEPRMYLEVQGWLTRVGQAPGQHSEHIHSGLCYPQGATWAPGIARLDYRHVFHNVVGYNVASVRGGLVDAGQNTFGATANTAAHLQALNAAADASAGTTKTVFQSYSIDIAKATCSGRVESRTGLDLRGQNVGAPGGGLVSRWFTSTGWQSYLPGSKPKCSSGRVDDVVICRNWASGFDYGNNGLGIHKAATAAVAKPEPTWSVGVGWASGVNRGSLHVDPDFHTGYPGIWSKTVTSNTAQAVPTSTFPSGLHRLVNLAHEGGGSRITSTVVCAVPFTVAG